MPFVPQSVPNPFIAREGEATPLNMFSLTLPNPFLAWEGEAPAEPWRIKLGRSLALPFLKRLAGSKTAPPTLRRWAE